MKPFWIVVKVYESGGRQVCESQQYAGSFESFGEACEKAKKSSLAYPGEFIVMQPTAITKSGSLIVIAGVG